MTDRNKLIFLLFSLLGMIKTGKFLKNSAHNMETFIKKISQPMKHFLKAILFVLY